MLTIITPKEITNGVTNALGDYSDWNSVATYSIGARVGRNGVNYESLLNSNLNRDPSIYYKGSTAQLSLITAWNSDSSYSAGDVVVYASVGGYHLSFQYDASITVQGKSKDAPAETTYYYIVESKTSSNTENPHTLLSTGVSSNWKYRGSDWKVISASNKAVFYDVNDGASSTNSLSSVSRYTGTMVCSFTASKMDSMALLNVEGATITVELTDDSTSDVYYSDTRSGLDTSSISNWYEYFKYEPTYLGNFYYTFPRYASGVTMTITITPPADGVSKCSLIMAGTRIQFGDVLFSPEYSLEDYSRKEADENGYVVLGEGRFRDKMDLEMIFPVGRTDFIITQLKKHRATPVIWIVDDSYSNGIIYGFYSDLSVNFQTHKMAHASLTIESL